MNHHHLLVIKSLEGVSHGFFLQKKHTEYSLPRARGADLVMLITNGILNWSQRFNDYERSVHRLVELIMNDRFYFIVAKII